MPAPKRRTSTTTVNDMRNAIDALNGLTDLLKKVLLGHRDPETNEDVPGVVGKLKAIDASLQMTNNRINARDKRDKWIWAAAGLLLTIGAADSVGVPTKEVGHFVVQQFWGYVVSHGMPPP